jgi:hypothetical protein
MHTESILGYPFGGDRSKTGAGAPARRRAPSE